MDDPLQLAAYTLLPKSGFPFWGTALLTLEQPEQIKSHPRFYLCELVEILMDCFLSKLFFSIFHLFFLYPE